MGSGEIRPFHNPFGVPRIDCNRINTQGDDGKEPPDDVLAKELATAAVELQPAAIDEGVAGFPLLHHYRRPGEGDTKCNGCD